MTENLELYIMKLLVQSILKVLNIKGMINCWGYIYGSYLDLITYRKM